MKVFENAGEKLPEYELSGHDVTKLYEMAQKQVAKERRAEILIEDMKQKAKEYRAEGRFKLL